MSITDAQSDQNTFSNYSYHLSQKSDLPAWQLARGERYLEYRRLWDGRPKNLEPGEFPLHLDIETTNNCNLKCVMCPRTVLIAQKNTKWSPKGIGYMDLATYKRLIDQAAAGGAYSVKLNFLGEPLIHPDVVDQVAYAHDRGLYVMMNTNAVALSEKMAVRLLEAGVDDVFFSIDATFAEAYDRIRVGAKFERVIKNVEIFVALTKSLGLDHVQTRASIALGADPSIDPETVKGDYERMFINMGLDGAGFGECYDSLADYSKALDEFPKNFTCDQLFQRMFVLWDGVYTPCCVNVERDYVLGDMATDTIAHTWQGEKYRRLRSLHQRGTYYQEPMCRRCVLPYQFAKAQAEAASEIPRSAR